MNKKCLGCGAMLQSEHPQKEGYIREENREKSTICERCFRMKHYGDYQVIEKKSMDFLSIFKKIQSSNDLVLLVVDVFDFHESLIKLKSLLKNPILLVVTKSDILPKSTSEWKILNYFHHYPFRFVDQVMISSKNNHNFDELYEKIKEHQTSKNVYVVGFTNAGKSSMINKLIQHYSTSKQELTISLMPSTTLDMIEIPIDETITLIDTPGLIDEGNIVHYLESDMIKKCNPKNGIKPITYQLKEDGEILIEDILKVEAPQNSNLTFYFSNALTTVRHYKITSDLTILNCHELTVPAHSDVVITGLGFIHVGKSTKLKIYTLPHVQVYIRDGLI